MPNTEKKKKNLNRLDLLGSRLEQSIMGPLTSLGIVGPPSLLFSLDLFEHHPRKQMQNLKTEYLELIKSRFSSISHSVQLWFYVLSSTFDSLLHSKKS